MRIVYASDQRLPQHATDTQQLVSMAAALGQTEQVTLWIPASSPTNEATLTNEVASYYGVSPSFELRTFPSLPGPRGLTKVTHALACARATHEAHSLDPGAVLYTRNLPIVCAALRLGSLFVAYETYRPWPAQRPWLSPLFRWIGRHPRFLGAVLHSDLAARAYLGAGLCANQMLVAHNGYEPKALLPERTAAAARAELGLPAAKTVVYTGHISPKKGLDLVLELARALPETRFVLVGSTGDGPIERATRGLANVTVVGWLPQREVVPYLYAADVLLIPPSASPLERVGNTVLPIKVFQYQAVGRAIFGPRTSDLTEVLTDGVTARLVPPDDLGTATSALRALLDDEPLRQRLGEAARTASQGHTWEHRAKRVLTFLRGRLEAHSTS